MWSVESHAAWPSIHLPKVWIMPDKQNAEFATHNPLHHQGVTVQCTHSGTQHLDRCSLRTQSVFRFALMFCRIALFLFSWVSVDIIITWFQKDGLRSHIAGNVYVPFSYGDIWRIRIKCSLLILAVRKLYYRISSFNFDMWSHMRRKHRTCFTLRTVFHIVTWMAQQEVGVAWTLWTREVTSQRSVNTPSRHRWRNKRFTLLRDNTGKHNDRQQAIGNGIKSRRTSQLRVSLSWRAKEVSQWLVGYEWVWIVKSPSPVKSSSYELSCIELYRVTTG
jgi:hypothetical protein